MRYAFYSLVAAYLVAWIWALITLPEQVPLHFGAAGTVDRWGSRTSALVTFAVLGAVVALLLGAVAGAVGRVDLSAGWFNLPYKSWWTATSQRAERARQMLRSDLYFLAAITMGMLVVALVATVWAADHDTGELGTASMVAIIALLAVILGWAGWIVALRYRPRETESDVGTAS